MMKRLLPLLAALLLAVLPSSAQSKRSLENQISRLEKDIALLNRQLKENSRSSEKALSSLTLVRRKISAREQLIEECDRSIRILDDSIRTCQAEIDRLQARNDTLTFYYDRLVRSAYKNRDSRMWYMYILSSGNMSQAFRRFGYLRGFASEMSAQAVRIRENAAELEVQKQNFLQMRDQADALRAQRVEERSKLQEEEQESAQLVTRLDKDRKKYQQQLQEKSRQKEKLNREIAEIIRKEQAAAAKKKGGTATSGGKGTASGGKKVDTTVDTKLSSEFAANRGKLPWPVEGVVVERFGKHTHPVYKNVELPQNNGVTLAVSRGAQAKAVFDGTVTQIVVLPGYNQCVLIRHGAYFTLYSKLKSVAVKVGDKVKTGQVVGTVDTIGGEDQFHFELWNGSTPQNPENWLR